MTSSFHLAGNIDHVTWIDSFAENNTSKANGFWLTMLHGTWNMVHAAQEGAAR